MIRRLLLILTGFVVAALGIFVALCVAVFLLLNGIYLFFRRSLFGAPQRKAEAGVIDGRYTVVEAEAEAGLARIREIERQD